MFSHESTPGQMILAVLSYRWLSPLRVFKLVTKFLTFILLEATIHLLKLLGIFVSSYLVCDLRLIWFETNCLKSVKNI